MKVVQFLGSTGWGGLENIFVSLCNELSKSVDIDVIIFKQNKVEKHFDQNVRVYLLNSSPSRFNPLLYIELYTILKKLHPDIVHTHGAKSTQIFYYLNKVLNILHIATKHNSRKGKIFNKLQNVIAVSQSVKESISHNNVKVIYNAIEPKTILPVSKNKIFTILAIGRLDKVKGFHNLIKECAKLSFPYQLQIVGEGEERESLEAEIQEMQLDHKINLLGFRKDIPQLMQRADVVVISSYNEGFSLVAIEALFYANVLVSTKVGGSIEILDKRFLINDFDIATKINHIHLNYKEYENNFFTLKNKYKDRFLLSHMANETILVYKKIKEIQ